MTTTIFANTLIPLPQSISASDGYFQLSPATTISADEHNQHNLEWLITVINETARFAPEKIQQGGQISLQIDDSLVDLPPEGYHLTIRPDGIELTAPAPTGVFYGIQTLQQMLLSRAVSDGEVSLAAAEIVDQPKYPWRGFMLDEGRHFQGIDAVKRLLDVMAALKMNIFHWHLTDDQGWRVEIKRYPRLIEVGSKRKGTARNMWSMFTGSHDGLPHSGFYTQAQIREVVAYAAERHITIVPEIEMPGHSTAALAAYPEFSCVGEPLEVRTAFGISREVFCIGREETFTFLQNILDEILDLFPGRYIHLGGDETPHERWQSCPRCQQRMADHGFSELRQLHLYLVNRMAEYLAAHGRQAVGWNESLMPGLHPELIIQYWIRGKEALMQAMAAGRKVIFSPYLDYYLDHSYSLTPLSRTYAYQPGFDDLNPEAAGNILGVEAPLWTEWVDSQARLDFQTFPRLLAAAETGWTGSARKDWDSFYSRCQGIEPLMERWGIRYPPESTIEPSLLRRMFGMLTIAQRQSKTV